MRKAIVDSTMYYNNRGLRLEQTCMIVLFLLALKLEFFFFTSSSQEVMVKTLPFLFIVIGITKEKYQGL